MMGQPSLRIVPCSVERAKEYVERVHRHHTASTSARYCVAAIDETGLVRGVAMVGRPVARLLDDGWTLEVNRVATDGCENACSALYGAARRIAGALGYSRLVTYIRNDEPGTSLRASGWETEGAIRARSWNMPGRARIDKTDIVPRERWSIKTTGAPGCEVRWPDSETTQMDLLVSTPAPAPSADPWRACGCPNPDDCEHVYYAPAPSAKETRT